MLPGVLLVAACGASDFTRETAWNLLDTRPDTLFEHRGEIRPDLETGWGQHDLGGWQSGTELTPEGRPFVSSARRVAVLMLPSDRPADRQLELVLWRGGAELGGLLAVRLNDIDLGTVRVKKNPNMVTILAPEEAWHWGPNVLELESTPTGEHTKRGWQSFALAALRYGDERRVWHGHDGIRLPPGTGMRYIVELLDRDRLAMEAVAHGSGELEIVYSSIDPESGTSRLLEAVAYPVAGEWGRTLVLPGADGVRLQLDVRWDSASDSPLDVSRLAVAGGSGPSPPPIVFISMDTLAARHMSLYGYERSTTPRLEDFARDAIVFESCMANAPWTLPSYLSVLTGLYPESHELAPLQRKGELEVWDRWQLAENRWTLAEMLRAVGYRTAAFVDTPWISHKYRMTQGFEVFDDSANGIPRHVHGGGIDHVASVAGEWIFSSSDARPPFAFMHAIDVHAPYIPPDPWRDAFGSELDPSSPRMVRAGTTPFGYGAMCEYALSPYYDWGPVPAEIDVRAQIAFYDEEILAMDAAVGAFFDELRRRGVYDDAVIIFTADHGEAFDHGFYGHSGTLYESIVKVPLIVKLPGSHRGGTRIAETVQLTDVYPTIQSLLSEREPHPFLHGRSLLPVIEGTSTDAPPAYTAGGLIEQRAVEHDGWKLIELHPERSSSYDAVLTHPRSPVEWIVANFPELEDGILSTEDKRTIDSREESKDLLVTLREMVKGPHYELYHLAEDPGEERDLAASRPDVLARMKALLAAERERLVKARELAKPLAVQVEMSDEDLEELRKLGYVDDQ